MKRATVRLSIPKIREKGIDELLKHDFHTTKYLYL